MGTVLVAASAQAAPNGGLKEGTPDLKSAGPLAFGPDGILFVGDTRSAAIFAIATGDTSSDASNAKLNVPDIEKKIAEMLGTEAKDVKIEDLAVNPASGNVFLSVTRGQGPEAQPVLLKVDGSGKISEVALKNVSFAKAELPNAPAPGAQDRRKRSKRVQSITDLAFVDGRVYIAGLSNEEFESTLRSIPFPFSAVDQGTGVKIFHGAHGRYETEAPVRTFTSFEINKEPHLLAAYTCTPLVKFPISDLKPGSKLQGTTIAELGNRNVPLDMFIYEKDGKSFVLMANTAHGVLKISTENFDKAEGITKQPETRTAGVPFETIGELKGVEQLDRLNENNAVVLVRVDDKSANLETVALP
jgi:hypothetical protein